MNHPTEKETVKQSNRTVLIVDDEEIVTESLGSFLKLETKYSVLTFQSPLAALHQLKQIPVDLVISDFLMPRMNGLEFLSEVKRMHPETPRIILTGYADKENAIRAINEVGLFQYIEKPWDNDQFKLVVDNAIATKSLKDLLREKVDELDGVLRQRNELFERDSIMKRELQMASRVQRKLLPQSLQEVGGVAFEVFYQPAMEVGGDFYDLIDLGGGCRAILLADVMGHGIQAALSTALLKFAFNSFSRTGATPAEILAGMNTILRKGLPTDSYVAAMVVRVDSATRQCIVSNGGLPYPYFLRRNHNETELVTTDGLLLGFADDDLFQPGDETPVALDRGDYLVIYTDGLNEAENRHGELFGQASLQLELSRLLKQKPGGNITAQLGQAVQQFSEGKNGDDITILGIEAK